MGNASASLTGDWTTRNDNLWSGARAQGPCPDGWKVPTFAESQLLTNTYGGARGAYISDADKRFRFNGDTGEYLYVAPRGFYTGTTFTGTDAANQNGSTWAATSASTNSQFIYVQLSAVVGNATGVARSWAMPVRCIQQ
ncbi:MAG: fibrobacter succinogenes major paralogous domain-containing protein [Tannerellaceae bacterium]|nr:fibrobacter succinogenes major paralogous domain-containing protein [Tannerellaceae bacterium]